MRQHPPSTTRPKRRWHGAAAAAAGSALAVFGVIASAGAVSIGGNTPFGLAPVTEAGIPASSYFQLAVGPGQSHSEQVVLTNFASSPTTFRLSPSLGTTAPNSGVSYTGAFERCQAAECWVSGLPPEVTLGGGKAKTISFHVTVPSGTLPGQYLAGITAEPVTSSGSVSFNQHGTSAKAIIVNQITVGVALNVGDVATLRPQLVITKVGGTAVGATPRLLITVRNEGQTFSKGKGTATCASPKGSLSFAVVTGTVLPGQSATVPVNAFGAGSHAVLNCSVQLGYSTTATQATWHGTVALPTIKPVPEYHIAPGVYSTLPPAKIPRWVIGVLAGASVLVLALIAALIVLYVRHRRHRITVARPPSAPAGSNVLPLRGRDEDPPPTRSISGQPND